MNKTKVSCYAVTIAIGLIIIMIYEHRITQEYTEESNTSVMVRESHIPVQKNTKSNTSDCLSSYPDFCIPPGTPDLDCPDIRYVNFAVRGSDPHRFDRDNDGIGCESSQVRERYVESNTFVTTPFLDMPVKQKHAKQDCLSSYPDFCIPSGPPDLNCSDIRYSDFTVRGSDPHGFDRDNDGIGCESATVKPQDTEPTPVKPKRTEPDISENCLDSYPDFCISPGPPDLNCSDIRQSDFTVRGNDPHGFDRDNDGIGCES